MGHPRVACARRAPSISPSTVSWLLLLAEHRRRIAQERQTAESDPGWHHGLQCTVGDSKLENFVIVAYHGIEIFS